MDYPSSVGIQEFLYSEKEHARNSTQANKLAHFIAVSCRSLTRNLA
jgi:hypothetical protein